MEVCQVQNFRKIADAQRGRTRRRNAAKRSRTMKGGARSRSGPAPDPGALRRERDGDDWVQLPAGGRKGRVPAWPLTTATRRERTVWNRLWKKPQAVVWEAEGSQDIVALYVRRFVEAEQRGSPTNLSTLVRQMADSLGLTTPGLRANRWTIVAEEEKSDVREQRVSSKSRLKVVPDVNSA